MGWAVQRADGSYRAWNAVTQDEVLRPGEHWVELPVSPVITPDLLTAAQLDAAAQAQFDTSKVLRALTLVLLAEINVLRAGLVPPLPARTIAQLRQAVIDQYKALP